MIPMPQSGVRVSQDTLIQECLRLRRTVVQPISDKHLGPLDKGTISNTLFPFVLLLGNHSSGKSSFINHLLKKKVQVSGVAPTDDCFTIIGPCAPGEDADREGPALIGDPDLGFSGLKHFGPILVHRTQLKIRSETAVKDFMLVDTPGMIDSALSRTSDESVMDRGYDFEGVCRWYAERADVILLFFDPDKPGTTGETLSILTNALVGLDHKLHIILNKVRITLSLSHTTLQTHTRTHAYTQNAGGPVSQDSRLCSCLRISMLELEQGHSAQGFASNSHHVLADQKYWRIFVCCLFLSVSCY